MDAAAELGRIPVSKHQIQPLSTEMSRLMRVRTAGPVSRDQVLRHARGQGNLNFPCSADHEQDWQPYPVDSYSAICDDHTYIPPVAGTHSHRSTTADDSSHPTFPRWDKSLCAT